MKVLGVGEPVRLEDKPRNRCRRWQLIVKVDLGDGKRHRKTRTFRGPYTQAVEATGGYAAELAGREEIA